MSGTVTQWLTLASSPVDVSSRITAKPRLFVQEFGDGHIARIPDGINNLPREFKLAYRNISPAEHTSLASFVPPLAASGATVSIRVLPQDPSGVTQMLAYVQDYTFGANEGGALWDWDITLREVWV